MTTNTQAEKQTKSRLGAAVFGVVAACAIALGGVAAGVNIADNRIQAEQQRAIDAEAAAAAQEQSYAPSERTNLDPYDRIAGDGAGETTSTAATSTQSVPENDPYSSLLPMGVSGTKAELANMMKRSDLLVPEDYPDNPWLAWDTVVPGSAMVTTKNDGRMTTCTLGFIGEQGGRYRGLTAGHCMYQATPVLQYHLAGETDLKPLGKMIRGQNLDKTLSDGANFDTDYAVIDFGDGIPGNMSVGLSLPVNGVTTWDYITPGMEVCKLGYRTGETCGPVLGVNPERLRANLYSASGDSGSPVYIKNPDGTATAVGLLSGSPVYEGESVDSIAEVVLVAPILDHLDMDLTPQLNR